MVAESGTYWAGRWRLAPCLVALVHEVDRRWPNRSKVSDGSIGDTSHQAHTSDHNPDASGDVLAIDITEDHARGPNLRTFWNDVIRRRDKRVKYLIYERQIVKGYVDSAGRPAWVPQRYDGINAHAHHLHVSAHDRAKADTTTWFPTEEDDMDIADLRKELTTAGTPTRTAIRELAEKGTRDALTTGGDPARTAVLELVRKALVEDDETRDAVVELVHQALNEHVGPGS